MKNMKRFFAMVLAVMMVLSLATVASADETTYTLTLNGAQEGHTYTAYQIFAGDLSDGVLSNIVWGSGVTTDGQTALGEAYKAEDATANATAAEIAESLTTVVDAETFAAQVAKYLGTAAGSTTIAEKATSGTITGLKAGYYLVMTTETTEENGVYTYYIMKVVEDTNATIKADVPEVDKEVDDPDANIGDTVTFTLTATMPSTLAGYETYKVIFHDTMSAGLKYTNNVKVTIGGQTVNMTTTTTDEEGNEVVTNNYTVSATPVVVDGKETGETELTVSFADVLTLGAEASSKIVVTYTAVLDEDAVIGTEGNPNEVYLEYSNDPNWDGKGDEPTGDTPEDEVKVYTWEIPVFKYTDTDTPVEGAGFTLYTDEDCKNAVNLVAAGSNIYKVCTLTDCSHTHVYEIVTDDTGKFEIEGLEKGTYYLKETTTPAGYNTCDVVTVVIGENGALTQNGTTTSEVAILNNKGATLPETGGIGTTMFYLIGGVMVLAAVVLLVTKKRMASAE